MIAIKFNIGTFIPHLIVGISRVIAIFRHVFEAWIEDLTSDL